MDKICKKCKYWYCPEQYLNGKIMGKCEKIRYIEPDIDKIYFSEQFNGTVDVGSDFGCIHFKKRLTS